VCVSGNRQVLMGTNLYLVDYDDRFMPVNYAPSTNPDPKVDKTWVQVLLPYTKNLRIFRCPIDPNQGPESEGVFDERVGAGDTYARYYQASLRVNVGYNFLYYSPVIWTGDHWDVQTRTLSQVNDSARATIFVDSVYTRDANGNPSGGGSYIVIPPCRYSVVAGRISDSFGFDPNQRMFTPSSGWDATRPNSPFRFGLAWPWHDGRMTVARLAGGISSITTRQLSEGCDARSFWSGMIQDKSLYSWDLN